MLSTSQKKKVKWSNPSHGAARYMRIVEPILYRDAAETKKRRVVKQKNIIHYVELHNGKLEKVSNREPSVVFFKQVYLAKDLAKVREQSMDEWFGCLVGSRVARWLWGLSGIAMG